MILFSAFRQTILKQQKAPIESIWLVQALQPRRFSSSLELVTHPAREEKPSENSCNKKLLRVAIVGRTNAGKSTLINAILNLNICGVSYKSHTTTRQLKAAYTEGDSQVVFLDTPGFVSKKEIEKFNLPVDFDFSQAKNFIYKVDMVGVVHEVSTLRDVYRFPINLVQCLQEIPDTKPMFLVVNKIDKITDKKGLLAVVEKVERELKAEDSNEKDGKSKLPTLWKRFSEVFFISALNSTSVRPVADYLLQQALPGEWLFDEDEVCDTPLHILVINILRAEMMNILPQEIPYQCEYNVEYMKENDLGEIICVCLVQCKLQRHVPLIVEKRKNNLRTVAKKVESSLFKILGKAFRIRVVVVGPSADKNIKKRKNSHFSQKEDSN